MTNKPMLSVERNAFEAFWRATMNVEVMDLHRCEFPMTDYNEQPYACHETDRAWMTWKGRAILDNQAVQQQGEPVAWTNNKPHMPGAYWIRGNGLDRDSLIEVVDDAGGLLCNLHQRTTEADFGYGYSIDDLSDEFEWRGPLYAEQPAPVADHTQCEECKGWGYHENHHEGGGTECGECGGLGNATVAVVMPERTMRSVMDEIQQARGFPMLTSNQCHALAEDLDYVARLNGVKP